MDKIAVSCIRLGRVTTSEQGISTYGEGRIEKTRPEVLFVCVRNAGRSQMAAALTYHLSDGSISVRSAGSQPGEEIHPVWS